MGFDKVEPVVKDYVANFNNDADNESHYKGIGQSQNMHDHLAEACKAS